MVFGMQVTHVVSPTAGLLGFGAGLGLDDDQVVPEVGLQLKHRVDSALDGGELGEVGVDDGDRTVGGERDVEEALEGTGEQRGVFLEDPVKRLVLAVTMHGMLSNNYAEFSEN